MIQRKLMIPTYLMIPAIRWSPAIWWSPAIRWSIGSMDFDNPKVFGDTSITGGLVSPNKDKIITKKDFWWSKWDEKRKKELENPLPCASLTCFVCKDLLYLNCITYITWITKNECMNDCRRCKSNAELLKCCLTCIRPIQSAFLHSGISCMYKLYLKCKYLYVDISKCMI